MIGRLAAVALLAVATSGCVMADLPPPAPSLQSIEAVRAANAEPMAVGSFTAAPGAPRDMDAGFAIRAGIQRAPGGSFARYLADTLSAELKGAGRLDPKSDLVLTGEITDAHADGGAPGGQGHARLAARFHLSRSGQTVFEKTLSVASAWDSDFAGAVAIPDAINHYDDLFRQLAATLFGDPDFAAAARPRASRGLSAGRASAPGD